ncbi:MAG: hypothetical protein JSS66_07725 [Armatimonadetes bacterium]|nr:hypothetical protein [Armatimonadota bacterium]
MFVAFYNPGTSGEDPSRRGFTTEEAAWNYIKSAGVCASCLEDLARGHFADAPDVTVTHVAHTSCGAEWDVEPETEYTADDLACIPFCQVRQSSNAE